MKNAWHKYKVVTRRLQKNVSLSLFWSHSFSPSLMPRMGDVCVPGKISMREEGGSEAGDLAERFAPEYVEWRIPTVMIQKGFIWLVSVHIQSHFPYCTFAQSFTFPIVLTQSSPNARLAWCSHLMLFSSPLASPKLKRKHQHTNACPRPQWHSCLTWTVILAGPTSRHVNCKEMPLMLWRLRDIKSAPTWAAQIMCS